MFGEAIQITTGSHPCWLPAQPASGIAERRNNRCAISAHAEQLLDVRLIVELANENVLFLIAGL